MQKHFAIMTVAVPTHQAATMLQEMTILAINKSLFHIIIVTFIHEKSFDAWEKDKGS